MIAADTTLQWRLRHAWRSESDVATLDACRRRLAQHGIALADASSDHEAQAFKQHGFEMLESVRRAPHRLADLAEVAAEQRWIECVDPRAWRFMDHGGAVFGIPMAIHQSNCFWSSRHLIDQVGAADGLVDWLRMASRHVEFPLVVGREPWRIGMLFEMLLAAAGGDAYRRAFMEPDAVEPGEGVATVVFAQLSQLRGFVDDRLLEVPWAQALRKIARGQAGAMVMGDWASVARLPELARVDLGPAHRTDVHIVDFFMPIRDGLEAASRRVAAVLTDPDLQVELAGIKGCLPAVRRAGHVPARSLSLPSLVFDQCCEMALKVPVLDLVAEHFLQRRSADESARRLAALIGR